MHDHMLFLLDGKQDVLIKSSAEFYTSGTKLILLRHDSESTLLISHQTVSMPKML